MSNNKITFKFNGLDVILLAIFIALKLCGVIDWSWWWVTSPIWIPLALLIVVAVIIGIIAIVTEQYNQ